MPAKMVAVLFVSISENKGKLESWYPSVAMELLESCAMIFSPIQNFCLCEDIAPPFASDQFGA